MRYADQAAVLAELSLNASNPDDAEQIARVVDLEEGLCLAFDEKIGRSFGEEPVPETRTVSANPPTWKHWMGGGDRAYFSNLLPLSTALRSLISIAIDGTWTGTSWVGGRTLDVDEYRLTNQARDGYYGIERVSGTWSGGVRITGIWADQIAEDVPDDVRAALNLVTAETYRQQQGSPVEELGPDGLPYRRNPWNYEQVKMAIKRHKIVKVLL